MANEALKKFIPTIQAGLALAAVIFSASIAHAQGTIVVGFAVPPDTEFQVGAPIYFDTAIQNSSTDTVRASMGHHGKWNYEFALVNPDGTTTAIPPYRKYGPGPKGLVTIGPNSTRLRRVVLDDWTTLPKPGEYTLKVRLTVLLSTSTNVSWQKEFFNDLRIVVGPRDPEKLRAMCERLTETALTASDADVAADAAMTLSYVQDPVAVPFQAKILAQASPAARASAVDGLVKIGNREAQEALKAGLATADADLKTKIEAALTQIKPAS